MALGTIYATNILFPAQLQETVRQYAKEDVLQSSLHPDNPFCGGKGLDDGL